MSIKANELRVGNWVQRPEQIRSKLLDDDRIYFLVDSIMIRDCEHYESNWAFEPIPLTPEILEKAGFDINSAEQWSLKKISISFPGVNGYKNGRVYFHVWCIIEDFFLSLHQLQNLFWCLTGEELEIKLQ